ncbi:Phosphatidylinositol-4-phosphate 5-kinase, partial [Ascosphaera acerosa]
MNFDFTVPRVITCATNNVTSRPASSASSAPADAVRPASSSSSCLRQNGASLSLNTRRLASAGAGANGITAGTAVTGAAAARRGSSHYRVPQMHPVPAPVSARRQGEGPGPRADDGRGRDALVGVAGREGRTDDLAGGSGRSQSQSRERDWARAYVQDGAAAQQQPVQSFFYSPITESAPVIRPPSRDAHGPARDLSIGDDGAGRGRSASGGQPGHDRTEPDQRTHHPLPQSDGDQDADLTVYAHAHAHGTSNGTSNSNRDGDGDGDGDGNGDSNGDGNGAVQRRRRNPNRDFSFTPGMYQGLLTSLPPAEQKRMQQLPRLSADLAKAAYASAPSSRPRTPPRSHPLPLARPQLRVDALTVASEPSDTAPLPLPRSLVDQPAGRGNSYAPSAAGTMNSGYLSVNGILDEYSPSPSSLSGSLIDLRSSSESGDYANVIGVGGGGMDSDAGSRDANAAVADETGTGSRGHQLRWAYNPSQPDESPPASATGQGDRGRGGEVEDAEEEEEEEEGYRDAITDATPSYLPFHYPASETQLHDLSRARTNLDQSHQPESAQWRQKRPPHLLPLSIDAAASDAHSVHTSPSPMLPFYTPSETPEPRLESEHGHGLDTEHATPTWTSNGTKLPPSIAIEQPPHASPRLGGSGAGATSQPQFSFSTPSSPTIRASLSKSERPDRASGLSPSPSPLLAELHHRYEDGTDQTARLSRIPTLTHSQSQPRLRGSINRSDTVRSQQRRLSRARRRWREDHDDDKVVVGTKVDQNHQNFVTAYNMLTGIRFTVSRTNAKLDRPLKDEDFDACFKFSFDVAGRELTPSAKYDFKFKDYAPWVFRHLRARFNLDPADYLMSLTSKYILSELGSPGKSGSFFYFSRDYKYIIKTIHHSEHKLLRRILRDYYQHVDKNPNTLISQFYGLHRVKMAYGRKIHFVVMNNLFPPHRDIHQMFDLKGSTVGRDYREEDLARNPRATMKDLNWLRREKRLHCGPLRKDVFMTQVKRDVALLQRLNIMDYSLLVGMHDTRKGNDEHLRDRALQVYQPGSKAGQLKGLESGTDEQVAREVAQSVGPDGKAHSGQGQAVLAAAEGSRLEDVEKTMAAARTAPPPFAPTTESGSSTATSQRRYSFKRRSSRASFKQASLPLERFRDKTVDEILDQTGQLVFYAEEGGFRATNQAGDAIGEIYYLGIIDCLTTYGPLKKAENFWKGLSHNRNEISPIPPVSYATRFVEFIEHITKSPEQHAKEREEAERERERLRALGLRPSTSSDGPSDSTSNFFSSLSPNGKDKAKASIPNQPVALGGAVGSSNAAHHNSQHGRPHGGASAEPHKQHVLSSINDHCGSSSAVLPVVEEVPGEGSNASIRSQHASSMQIYENLMKGSSSRYE